MAEQEHYFSSDPAAPFRRVPVSLHAWGHTLDLTTAAGVFALGRLDAGTSVLFRETEPPAHAETVLDLGCGYGVIGLALASAVPTAQVWAVDVNRRALAVAGENARALHLADRFRAVEPGDVPPQVRFDEIWSNPPIRVGKEALHALLVQWLGRLVPEGRAVMVVGRNLGADSLQRWLDDQGYPTRRLASAKGFRVLETRPLRA